MKQAGASLSSEDAVNKLIEYLENSTKEITSRALENAKHSGRKKK